MQGLGVDEVGLRAHFFIGTNRRCTITFQTIHGFSKGATKLNSNGELRELGHFLFLGAAVGLLQSACFEETPLLASMYSVCFLLCVY